MADDESLREAAHRTASRITDMVSRLPVDRPDGEVHRIMVTCIALALSGHYTAGLSEGRRQARLDARSVFLFGLLLGMLTMIVVHPWA